MVSEARLAELLTTYHLLFLILGLAALELGHLVKALFRLLRGGTDQTFGFLTFLIQRWYKFLGDVVEARNEYKHRLELTRH